jgi:hypothetical protein
MKSTKNIILAKDLLSETSHKGKSLNIQSSKINKYQEKFANQALTIFDEHFINQTICDQNKKVMKDISSCVAELNKTTFLKKFEINETFEHKTYLKASVDLVIFLSHLIFS